MKDSEFENTINQIIDGDEIPSVRKIRELLSHGSNSTIQKMYLAWLKSKKQKETPKYITNIQDIIENIINEKMSYLVNQLTEENNLIKDGLRKHIEVLHSENGVLADKLKNSKNMYAELDVEYSDYMISSKEKFDDLNDRLIILNKVISSKDFPEDILYEISKKILHEIKCIKINK